MKQKICLTMIVKDESAVIRRALRSVKKYIDCWAIADTGSTDGTQDIIREELAGIPGELIERPWVDFATNRNEAIEAGQQFEPDWMLTLDADEWLETKPGFTLSNLAGKNISATFRIEGNAQTWPRRLLFRPDNRYRGVLDEHHIDNDEISLLPCCLVRSGTDGNRSSLGLKEKFRRDSEVYRKALEHEPENERYWYYYGQRLAGCHEYEKAIEAYKKRIELGGGFLEEIYQSKFVIGQCRERLGHDWKSIVRDYQAAFEERPTRAEPLFALGCLHAQNEEFALAEMYFRQAQRMPRPTSDSMLIDESIYAWNATDFLAGMLAERGKLRDALDLLLKLRALPQLPESEHERVDANIEDLRSALKDDEEEKKTDLGPDEQIYLRQAKEFKRSGLSAFRQLSREYLESFTAQTLPSPARWLWICLVAVFGKWVSVVCAVLTPLALYWAVEPIAGVHPAVVALAAGSPLLWMTARRHLQDSLIATLTLVGVGFAVRGEPVWLAVALAVALCCKEAAVFTIPALALAWLYSGASWLGFGAAIGSAVGVFAVTGWALLGEMWLPVLRAGSAGHSNPYTADYQRGAPHRLIVDLVLVSPVCTLVAIWGAPVWLLGLVAAIVGAHALAPVRNVRLIISAELLLRASVAIVFGWWALPIIVADALITNKLRQVYDPVTAALTAQLGMSK